MKKFKLEIPEDDIEEVIHLLRYAACKQSVSNDVWTLIMPFCEEHSKLKFGGKPENLVKYPLLYDNTIKR